MPKILWPLFSGHGVESLSHIVWVYLRSNLCSALQKTYLFCNRVRFGRSWSFKVRQGRWF